MSIHFHIQTKLDKRNQEYGFSLVELMVSLVLTLVILGIAVTTFSSALSSKIRESSTTDGITSAQAALNIMSREIGNSGYGLSSNGIVLADSGAQILRIRSNTANSGVGSGASATSDPGEDVTFYFDNDSKSVVRYDRNLGTTSGVINRISNVNFKYIDDAVNSNPDCSSPTSCLITATTTRVRIILTVNLDNVQGQPINRQVTVKSDVTLRNSPYHLRQY